MWFRERQLVGWELVEGGWQQQLLYTVTMDTFVLLKSFTRVL